MSNDVFDWAEHEPAVSVNPRDWDRPQAGHLETRRPMNVNPVNGHGVGCVCSQCPGWYDTRVAAEARFVGAYPVVPAERRPRPLTDIVVPVCALLTMLTVCAVILIPVVTPLIGLAAVSTVAVAVAVVALASVALVFLMFAMKLRKSFDREPNTLRGRVIGRR
jgi:hypothetical protein